jgi:hypothetical protein
MVDRPNMRVFCVFSCLFLVACSENKALSLNLKHMIETSYKKPDSHCKELAHVTGFALKNIGFARSYQESLNTLLKETHATGGNFVYIKRASLDGTNLDGVSYSCSKIASQ